MSLCNVLSAAWNPAITLCAGQYIALASYVQYLLVVLSAPVSLPTWCVSAVKKLQTVSVEHRSAAFWAECCLDVWVCTRQRVWSKCSMLVREQEPAIQQCMTSLWFHHELEILPHRLLVQWTSIELKRVKINTAHTHHVGREIKPAFQTTNRLLSHIMWVHPCIDQLQSTTVSAFCCT